MAKCGLPEIKPEKNPKKRNIKTLTDEVKGKHTTFELSMTGPGQ